MVRSSGASYGTGAGLQHEAGGGGSMVPVLRIAYQAGASLAGKESRDVSSTKSSSDIASSARSEAVECFACGSSWSCSGS
jgi:hypothetical protein